MLSLVMLFCLSQTKCLFFVVLGVFMLCFFLFVFLFAWLPTSHRFVSPAQYLFKRLQFTLKTIHIYPGNDTHLPAHVPMFKGALEGLGSRRFFLFEALLVVKLYTYSCFFDWGVDSPCFSAKRNNT